MLFYLPLVGLLAFFFAGPKPYAIAGLLLLPVWMGFTAWLNPYVTPLESAEPAAT